MNEEVADFLKLRMILELFFKQENLKKESKYSKLFIMRTLLQKLKVPVGFLPIFLMVAMLQVDAFSQQCDVIAVDCEIVGCPEETEVFIGSEITPPPPDLPFCGYVYTLPGLSGSGECVTGDYRIELKEYVLYQYNTTPMTQPVGTIASTQAGATNNTVTFPSPGTYVLLYHLFDESATDGDAIPDACCTSTVEVKVAQSIACNDQVQVTMDGECNATITLDMILEGEDGACNYNDHYLMTIDGFGTNETEITIDTPGEYSVTVFTPTGEQCWGSILVEDKISAVLTNCQDFEIFCNQTYEPGDPILDFHVVGPNDTDGTNFPQDSVGTNVFVDSSGDSPDCVSVAVTTTVPSMVDPDVDSLAIGIDSIIFDLTTVGTNQTVQSLEEIAFTLDVPNINTIKACLKAPDGTIIEILDLVSGNTCSESDLDIILRDDAFRTHAVLVSPANCGLGSMHAYCGDYKPLNPLSGFNGVGINGEWVLIIKNFSTTETACITGGSLSIIGDSGTVPYPFDGDVTQTDAQEYLITLPDNNCGPYLASYEDETVSECPGGVIGSGIERTWTVVSQSSGVESMCRQIITINFFPLEDLITPPNYDGTDFAPFFCSQFFDTNGSLITSMLTDEGAPLPSVTGGIEAPFGEIGLCANYGFTYQDQILPICGAFAKKVLREFTLLDWCSGAIRYHTQIIKIVDNDPPIVTAVPDDISINTNNGFTCTADWDIVPPLTVFDCGFSINPDSYAYSVGYLLADDNGEPPVDGEYIMDNVRDDDGDGIPDRILDLPQGRTWIKYTVVDDCGNVGEAFTEVDVIDVNAPNPVCVEFLVLSLGDDGCAHAGAESFDKGSWDNCGVDYFEVRRLDINDDFGPYVDYCCTDFTDAQKLVELRVYDFDGNTNTCIVEVELQNPFGIVWDSTADPVYNFDCEDELPTCDTYMDLFSASHNLDGCPLTITCDGPKQVSEIDDCGNGTFEIIYTASNGTSDDISYTVRLNFSNLDPFDPETDVDWSPLNTGTINGCPDEVTLDPGNANIGRPIVDDSPCGLIAMTYEDQIFDDVENACQKVLRTWTVIDWCTYDPAFPNQEVATFVQVLKINDIELPEFNCSPPVSSIFGEENSCNLNTTPLDTLGILILDESEGFDACSEALDRDYDIEYEIDYNRDGSIDASGTGRNANGIHDYGSHTITWTITDHCGNVNSCSYNFQIEDSKPPTPYCRSTIVTVTMPVGTGSVEVWANEFDLGSTDNVTGECNDNELIFTLVNTITGESSGSNGSLTFDCADMPNGISIEIPLEMYVTDEFGNSDFCAVTLLFQDNENDSCPDDTASRTTVSGNVYTETNDKLPEAMVSITNNFNFSTQMMTPDDGHYAFEEVPMYSDYELVSEKEDVAVNGITTLDLVLIQKHILDLVQLQTPYKIIAADANRSGSVSSLDMVVIRKIILGIEDSFPNDDMPWRFVDSSFEFADVSSPFPYDESINLTDLDHEEANKNFIAVKIGDVNGTAVLNTLVNSAVSRSANYIELNVENLTFEKGDAVEIPVTAANFDEIVGAQFTLMLNTEMVDFNGIEAGAMDVKDQNFGFNYLSEGYVTASWNNLKAVTASEDDVLFTINLIAKQSGSIANVMNINSDVTTAEVYNNTLETMDIQLNINGQTEIIGYELYQNVPNPFGSETKISFKTPVDGMVVLTVFDVNGKLVKKVAQDFNKGTNSIVLSVEDLKAKGIFYYQMEAEGFTATKKMIVLE